MRVLSVAGSLSFALAATALFAGCGGQSSTPAALPGAASNAAAVTRVPISDEGLPNSTLTVGIRLSNTQPHTSKHYGKVLGYFKGTTSKVSQVVLLSANTNVVFTNVDSFAHTASFLGDATRKSAPWPSSFNGTDKASAAGTAIGTTNFSTGTLNGGKSSAVYTTGSPGFYMFGCFFHYDSSGMRTVIIVR